MKINKTDLLLTLFLGINLASLASPSDTLKRDTTILLREGIVVTAQRMETKAYDITDAVVSLDRNAILRLSPMNTPDAMSSMAGVWMQKTNHGGGSPFIRGLTGYHTLLLVDGIRFNNSTFRSGPNQYLSTIDPLTLSRIEVLRGQGAVQYGSDGIGGVAHLFFREPEFSLPNRFLAKGRMYGRVMDHDMEYSGRAEAELSTSKVAFLGGIAYKNFGDIHAGESLGRLKSTGYDELSWDAKIKTKIRGMHVTAAWQHLVQNDVPLYHQLGPDKYSRYHFSPQQRDLGYIRLESFYASNILSKVRYTVAYLNSLEKREKQKVDDPIIRFERDNVDTYHAAIEIVSDFSKHWKASSGVEIYHDRIGSTAHDDNQITHEQLSVRGLYPDGSTYSNLAAFSLHSLEFNKFNFNLGARYNFIKLNVNDPVFGSTSIKPDAAVWNAGVIFKATKAIQLITSANMGFRAPNVNDVASFGIADYRYEVPNFNLEPEKSLQYQAGFRTQTRKLKSEVFIYQNSLSNLIGNVSSTYNGNDSLDGFKVYQKENINKARIRGIEAEMQYQPNRWLSAFASYTFTKGVNISRDEPLSRIPPSFGRIGFDINFTDKVRWRVEGIAASKQNLLSSGDKQDSRIPEGGTPGWSLLNTRFQFIYRNIKINTGIQNLFNKAYRVHGSGVDGVGRSFWVSLIFEVGN